MLCSVCTAFTTLRSSHHCDTLQHHLLRFKWVWMESGQNTRAPALIVVNFVLNITAESTNTISERAKAKSVHQLSYDNIMQHSINDFDKQLPKHMNACRSAQQLRWDHAVQCLHGLHNTSFKPSLRYPATPLAQI